MTDDAILALARAEKLPAYVVRNMLARGHVFAPLPAADDMPARGAHLTAWGPVFEVHAGRVATVREARAIVAAGGTLAAVMDAVIAARQVAA